MDGAEHVLILFFASVHIDYKDAAKVPAERGGHICGLSFNLHHRLTTVPP